MFLPISALGLGLGALQAQTPQWRERILRFSAAVAVGLTISYVTYPYLLRNPIDGLWELVSVQASYDWLGTTLTLGENYRSVELPWWYATVWLGVTLPVLVLAGLVCGLVVWLLRPRRPSLPVLLTLVSGLFPFAYVTLAGAPLYDGPRHILFLMPIFTLLAALGLRALHQRLRYRWVVPSIGSIAALLLILDLVRLHPYQTAWFNRLAGGIEGASGKFTLDYWGSTSKESATWLAENGDRKTLCVVVELRHAWDLYLPKWAIEDELTLKACPLWARYAYSFSRNDWLDESAAYSQRHPQEWEPVHHIKRQGVILGTVFKNPNPIPGP